MRLYEMRDSGNCYKIRLCAAQVGQKLDLVPVDILKGESRTDAFLTKNPNGRVPTLELDDGTCLPESNAAIFYLAEGTPLLSEDRLIRAQTLQWMFFEQYSHEPYIAVARFWKSIQPGGEEEKKHMFPEWHERGHQALSVMERHLADNEFFAGGAYSIADIALYAYTHVAHEGGFSLDAYPYVRTWIDKVSSQSGHIPMM
ncbi:glutathione S-transferase family protein [Parvibaculaceae bacterium PLY_AMNH_Bact1]|nr:glutathione S-transferase family protein [Parvibaculaceae bacterium PLY_AMNH_Bact1]